MSSEEIQYIATTDQLTSIANAIREVGTTTANLQWPTDFISEINNLEGTPSIDIDGQSLITSGTANSDINRGDKVTIYWSAAQAFFVKAPITRELPILRFNNYTTESFGYALKNMTAYNTYTNAVYKVIEWTSEIYSNLSESAVASVTAPKTAKKRSTKKATNKE